MPLAKHRTPLIEIPTDLDWPGLVTGEKNYSDLAAAIAQRRERFKSDT